jgi:hypothetical protein
MKSALSIRELRSVALRSVSQTGAATIEAALVFGALFLLVMGMFSVSHILTQDVFFVDSLRAVSRNIPLDSNVVALATCESNGRAALTNELAVRQVPGSLVSFTVSPLMVNGIDGLNVQAELDVQCVACGILLPSGSGLLRLRRSYFVPKENATACTT